MSLLRAIAFPRLPPGLLGAPLAACLLACSPHLAGANDAALEYQVEPDPATGQALDTASTAARMKARLTAAQTIADVEATPSGTVRVVIDADATGVVDSLVRWRGGLDAYLVDDGAAFDPRSAQDLVPAQTIGAGEILSVDTSRGGRALSLTLAAGATSRLAAEGATHPGARVAFVRGHTLLCTTTLAAALATPLEVSFGDDITAYTRAYHAGILLESPPLPPVRRIAAVALPPRWGLAAACAILPVLISLAWLAFVRRFDRARPEPLWLVLATFGLGSFSVIPAGLVEYALASATPWLDPSIVTLGGQLRALPLAIAVSTVVVGGAEEGAKLLGVWALAWRRREFDEPVDGIVYACAASLGFAAAENVRYFAFGRMSGSVIAMRGFLTVPAHMLFATLWGYALGQSLVSRHSRILAFAVLAAFAHGLFDALLSTNGLQLAATVLVLGLAIAFVVLLQRALAHGAVPRRERQPAGAAPPTEPAPASLLGRVSFRVGSPLAFYACAAGMVVCAFGLTLLGAAYEILHHRVGPVFVGLATGVLALFGVAAYGASETIPLDAVVDAQGITFSGARTSWRALLGAQVVGRGRRAFVVVQAIKGNARLGPTTEEQARAIATAIQTFSGGSR